MAANVNWWVVDALEKIFPESMQPARPRRNIELWAAGNETEDVQIALAVPKAVRIRKARFSFSPLSGPAGHTIAPSNCRAHWQWFTYVIANPLENKDPATVLRQAPAFLPDAFLEEQVTPLRAGITQPVWVSVTVPTDTPAGEYQGRLTFHLEGPAQRQRIQVPLSLHVWPFNLPQKPTLRHTEWFFPESLARYYHLEMWSEPFWIWVERVAADMAAHKQNMIITDFTKLVSVVPGAGGDEAFDFSRLDRWLSIFQKAGVEWIEGAHVGSGGGGQAPEMILRRWAPLDPAGRPVGPPPEKLTDAQCERRTERLLKEVYVHLKRQGLADRYVQHIADEPNAETQASWSRLSRKVKKWLPNVPRVDAMPASGMQGDIEIRVPMINEILQPASRAGGEELWSYVCLSPQTVYPNRFLDYPSIRNRIIFWLSWTLRLKGFLHWGYNAWSPWGCPIKFPINPWTDATAGGLYHTFPLPAGDPHIVYPGRSAICSSIRWETVRKGFEDYEYLRLLQTAVEQPRKKAATSVSRGRELLELVRTEVARNPIDYTQDTVLLQSVRRQTGDLLADLTSY